MRVIGGEYKGQRLKSQSGLKVRPITDRVKESVFDILGEEVEGACVLDLFAGTGSLGIECLSRGAVFVCFIDKHPGATKVVRENLKNIGIEKGFSVLTGALPGSMRRLKGGDRLYNLIFIDPPFRIGQKVLSEVFQRVSESSFLAKGAKVVYRHSPRLRYDPPEEMWRLVERRSYGDSVISIHEVAEGESRNGE